jgi:S1-C subfamily serine protease
MTRETRLLLATIAVSVVVVLVLSTLRFPETPRISEAPPAPLERLAASAAYEQLARSVEGVSRRVAPDLLVVRVAAGNGGTPISLSDLLRSPVATDAPRYFPALRVDDERAVLTGIVDPGGSSLTDQQGREVPVIAIDPLRRVALLAVSRASGNPVTPLTLSALQTPTYVVVAEGTAAGIAFRPVFVGSADRFSDPRWGRQLLAVSGTPLTSPGALVFSLESQFVGAAIVQPNGTLAIAGAAELIAVAADLRTTAMMGASEFGVGLQPMAPELSAALAVSGGVLIASVDANGPSFRSLEVLDVITGINGTAVTSPDEALVRLARTPSGSTAQLAIVRNKVPMSVTLTAPSPTTEGTVSAVATEAVTFDRVPGTGSRVTTVAAASALGRAGVRVGDLVVRAGDLTAPTPLQLAEAMRDASTTGLLLVVRRNGDRDRVIALSASAPPR